MSTDQALSIAGLAVRSGSFDILEDAVTTSGLGEALAAPDADFTVFAPTDEAFTTLAQDLGYLGDPKDADAVFSFLTDALGSLSPDGNPVTLLTDVLQYHVSPGAKTLSEVASQTEVATLLTEATVSPQGSTLADNDPDVPDPQLQTTDIQASNGIVHTIDRVLLPSDLPASAVPGPTGERSIADVVSASGNFDILTQAVGETGLAEALAAEDADLTVFAPTDKAFTTLAQNLGFQGNTNDDTAVFDFLTGALGDIAPDGDAIQLLTDVLQYHVSAGSKDLNAVAGLDQVTTLLGGATFAPDGTDLADNEPDLTNPTLINTDIQTDNGIVHAIDRVLLPSDLPGNADVLTITGTDSADQLTGRLDSETLRGRDGDDTLDGGDGADLMIGGPGADALRADTGDTLVTGVGADRIEIADPQGTITWADPGVNDTLILTGLELGQGHVGVENASLTSGESARLRFDLNGDGSFGDEEPLIVLDSLARADVRVESTGDGGTAIQLTGPDLPLTDLPVGDQINALYVTYFGRPGEPQGVQFWKESYADLLDQGREPLEALTQIAEDFRSSEEAISRFPVLDPAAAGQASASEVGSFVDAVYGHLFDRAPDDAGQQFWTGLIQDRVEDGQEIGSVLIDIAAAASDNGPNDPAGAANDATAVRNKVEVSEVFAEQLDQADADLGVDISVQQAADVLNSVGPTYRSFEDAVDQIGTLVNTGTDDGLMM